MREMRELADEIERKKLRKKEKRLRKKEEREKPERERENRKCIFNWRGERIVLEKYIFFFYL